MMPIDVTLLHADVACLRPLADQALEFARRSRSENTLRGYRADWNHFNAWCKKYGLLPLPAAPATVAVYLSALADVYKVSTILRRIAAIGQHHLINGVDSPAKTEAVRTVLKGIKRTLRVAPQQKAPLLANDLRQIVADLPRSLMGARDRALLLVGFAGAFRRSELMSLDVEDLTFVADGLIVSLRYSKVDQEGKGRKIGIPRLPSSEACPVRAARDWLDLSGIKTGALFRRIGRGDRLMSNRLCDHAVALIVKRSLSPARDARDFAGHSLRSGFATSAAQGGASINAILRQTGHVSVETALRYVREASLFRGNALTMTGL
jgi:integrase